MGYYTDFDFNGNRQEVIRAIEDSSGYGKSESGLYSQIKWYDWNKNLLDVSLLFPNEVIIISGKGEESEDMWRAFFKNGKSKTIRPEITFPTFDEDMLK